jgi:hypothetical protein
MAVHRVFDPKFFGPLEAVDFGDLVIDNEIFGPDEFPLLRVVSIEDVQDDMPSGEGVAGTRLVRFESLDDYGRVRRVLHYGNCDSVVVRRRMVT